MWWRCPSGRRFQVDPWIGEAKNAWSRRRRRWDTVTKMGTISMWRLTLLCIMYCSDKLRQREIFTIWMLVEDARWASSGLVMLVIYSSLVGKVCR